MPPRVPVGWLYVYVHCSVPLLVLLWFFGAYVKLQDVSVFLGMMDLCVCVEEGVFLWVWLYV